MPILTEDPRRLTHPHNLSFPPLLSQTTPIIRSHSSARATPNPARITPRIETWRGRKRSRSPSTSPVGSPERSLKRWSGVRNVERGPSRERTGIAADGMERLDQESRYQQRQSPEGADDGYAVRSGVQLVLPTEEEPANQPTRTVDEMNANLPIDHEYRPRSSKRKASLPSIPSSTPHLRSHDDAPKVKRTRFKGSLEHHCSSASIFDAHTAPEQEVPVWDVNKSLEISRGGAHGGCAGLLPRADSADVGEGGREDASKDLENGYYVSSNMMLRDLHLQRRTRRPFVKPVSEKHKEREEPSHQPQLLPPSASNSSPPSLHLSPTTSSRSGDSYGNSAALLVAEDTGANITRSDIDALDGTGGTSVNSMKGQGRTSSPRRMHSYMSDEEDGSSFGLDPAAETSGNCLVSGYEDMNRLLGRLAIQRRGCR